MLNIKKIIQVLIIITFCFINTDEVFSGAGVKNKSNTWPRGKVYYDLHRSLTPSLITEIEKAVFQINTDLNETGVEVLECNPNNCNRRQTPPVTIRQKDDTCSARVGFVDSKRSQTMSLDSAERCSFGTIIHEFGHSIGLFHEHQRPDRNKYIKFNSQNVDRNVENRGELIRVNFNIKNSALNQGEYDYQSIMHYSPCTLVDRNLSCSTHPTLEKPDNAPRIASRGVFSEKDIQSIKGLYGNRDLPPIAKEDNYILNQRTNSISQKDFTGNTREDKDIGLLYNDGDFNGDIDRIEVVVEPAVGTLDLTETGDNKGNFTFDFGDTAKKDSFSYRLIDKRGNRSSPVVVVVETTTDPITPPPPLSKHTLSITTSGSGTVTSTPSGISCGSDCTQDYSINTRVTMRAIPRSGYRFDRWLGDCIGSTSTTRNITMSTDKSCQAIFVRR